jgi:hypothetical protein
MARLTDFHRQQAVCAEWPCEEGSLVMGCDDALEVEEFVVMGDYIDDMSGWS